MPWARSTSSDFTLLFEQTAMSLVKEMTVLAVSRQLEISLTRLCRIVYHYVGWMLGNWILDLSNEATVGVDKTASRCGQRYVTVFLHMQRKQEPVIFAVPGHGKNAAVSETLERHAEAVVRRWITVLTNVRLEGMTGLFGQAKTT
ncbi:helix-turn-helix domain-containing protein [Halomonas sp. G15]|uniref:helix-turn-helix domain-containing protein n=1 Tax=Halomonas sp. G15 TaxID=2903521 RepID=UPI002FCD9F62